MEDPCYIIAYEIEIEEGVRENSQDRKRQWHR